jgi:hypothetical protein
MLKTISQRYAGSQLLRLSGKLSGTYRLKLLDVQGRSLRERAFQAAGELSVQEVDGRSLAPGVYFLRIRPSNPVYLPNISR